MNIGCGKTRYTSLFKPWKLQVIMNLKHKFVHAGAEWENELAALLNEIAGGMFVYGND